jgi:hypothetical protein
MKAIRAFAGQALIWAQPRAMRQQFALYCGDEVLAIMRWQSSWRSDATAETAEGSWSFQRRGFSRQVIIESSQGGAALPTLTRGWTGSATLSFPDGHGYLWKRTGFWGSRRAWTTAEGVPLLSIKTRSGFLKMGAEVEIQPFAAALPELALLMTLGWYLAVLEMRDASAAAASSAAVMS